MRFWAIQPASTTGMQASTDAADSFARKSPRVLMFVVTQIGHGRAVHRVELDGVEELVPGEDHAQQRRRGDARRGDRQDDRRQLPAQAGAVDLGRLDQLARDLLEERPQHPHRQRQVDARCRG